MWHKIPAPINFRYPDSYAIGKARGAVATLACDAGRVTACLYERGIARISVRLGNQPAPTPPAFVRGVRPVAATVMQSRGEVTLRDGDAELRIAADGSFVHEVGGHRVVTSAPAPFGQTGSRQIALFEAEKGAVVYGLGEKTGGIDKAGRAYQFWNVDVVADHPATCMGDGFDPGYVSIPFYISKANGRWFGVLLDNPFRTFVHAGLDCRDDQLFHPGLGRRGATDQHFALGAWQGRLNLWLFPGPTLGDVVRNFAALTGRHELPPVWALGYHQCRWSYMSAAELQEVADRLADARIPVGAMWMDIDYMDAFRVFTWRQDRFSEEQRRAAFEAIRARGTRLVTIVDPGVKAEPGLPLYEEGLARNVYCQTEAGAPYIGLVWPGRTVFPDYSLTDGRAFWAEHVRRWAEGGMDGIWNDMNDPSTGPIDLADMRFARNTMPHEAYHNLYGNLMARATLDGLRAARPDARPFILTRSASTGAQQLCAVWTGDNASNPAHLAMSIPMSLNLSLSGVSFNGPDVGGFMEDVSEELLVTWMLAGGLFPFFRNHSCAGTRRQEPHMFQPENVDLMRRIINTRAKLLPYLYNEFVRHQEIGDAVMRPLSYEFDDPRCERIGDQFLIGPALMTAPFVKLRQTERDVYLPSGWWYDLRCGEWLEGGRVISQPFDRRMSLFARDGSIIPTVAGDDHFPQPDFRRLEFHVFCKDIQKASYLYQEDDGESMAWQRGARNLYEIKFDAADGLGITPREQGYQAGAKRADFHFHGLSSAGAASGECQWPFSRLTTRMESRDL